MPRTNVAADVGRFLTGRKDDLTRILNVLREGTAQAQSATMLDLDKLAKEAADEFPDGCQPDRKHKDENGTSRKSRLG